MKLEKIGLDNGQIFFTVLAIFLWVFLFGCGLVVNSEPYRNVLSEQTTVQNVNPQTSDQTANPNFNGIKEDKKDVSVIWALTVVIFIYTPTNIIFLCLLAGLLGSTSRIAVLHAKKKDCEDIPIDRTNPLLSGALRGLLVYFIVISGVLVINEAPFITPTPNQYARLSGIMSLFSFLVSYNPSQFDKILSQGLNKINDTLKGGKDRL